MIHSNKSFVFRRSIVAAVVLCCVVTLGLSVGRAADRVRPYWGSAALWAYWEFEDQYVPKRDWKIVTVSTEGATNKASNLIDDDTDTSYYPKGEDVYTVTIDLGKSYNLGALTVVTANRPNNAIDSRMVRYELFVGDAKEPGDKPVASGPFEGDEGAEAILRFAPTAGRYVTLKAYPRDKVNREICLRELSLVAPDVLKAHDAARQSAAAERRKAWEARNSDGANEALGKELADLLFCTPDDINRTNLRNRPRLEAIGKMKAAGKFEDVPRQFRDYFFDKLRRPQSFGLPGNDLQAYGKGYAASPNFRRRRWTATPIRRRSSGSLPPRTICSLAT